MKEVMIKKIYFENKFGACGSLDQSLMKGFQKYLDTEEVKEIMAVLLKDLANHLNIFEWGIGFSFSMDENDLDAGESDVVINVKAYQSQNTILEERLYFCKSRNDFLEFRYSTQSIYENGVEKTCNDFLNLLKNSKAYIHFYSSKYINNFEKCSQKLIQEQDRALKFLDHVNKELSFKYTKQFAECNLNYLIGEQIILGKRQLKSGDNIDFKDLLKDMVIYKVILNKMSEENIESIFESDDMQGIIDNLKVLCY